MPRKSLSAPEKLTIAAAKDYPGAEILVSFPDRWELVDRFKQEDESLYIAGFPCSHEKPRSDHFFGLSPEINRSLTTYRQYRLFEPWPTPLLQVIWDQVKNEGRVLDGCRLRIQLQDVGQAQIWKGPKHAVLWECYSFATRRQTENWQEELTMFWQVVERDIGVRRIFTQPREPTFREGYTEFLSRLGYAPDRDFERWWSKANLAPNEAQMTQPATRELLSRVSQNDELSETKKLYHVFTHKRDEWLESYDEAVGLFSQWSAEYGSARLYEEEWENPQFDDDPIRENCLLSHGEYPW